MISTLEPATPDELADAVRATPRVLAVGARTKPRLSRVPEDVVRLSTAGLRGIIEYDPGEFTFTALAGTRVREIAAALAERGQYLPFDPMLLDAGTTLGGTVASGLSGPGRFRFGGIRDFILGVRFVDGEGRLLRMGGKVVKNAAGFDLPKFFVGSLGRFGVLAEMTFKVFPRPASTLTLRLTLDGIDAAARVLTEAANTRWEPDALEVLPDGRSVLLRLAAPEPAIAPLSREILGRWPGEALAADEAAAIWTDIREFRWAHSDGTLMKVATTAAQLPALFRSVSAGDHARIHVSAGGDVAFISSPNGVGIDATLRDLGLRGMTLRGAGPLWCGVQKETQIARNVKSALDPEQRFPDLAD
jgi:glycolate oxidase FAD binding subunit